MRFLSQFITIALLLYLPAALGAPLLSPRGMAQTLESREPMPGQSQSKPKSQSTLSPNDPEKSKLSTGGNRNYGSVPTTPTAATGRRSFRTTLKKLARKGEKPQAVEVPQSVAPTATTEVFGTPASTLHNGSEITSEEIQELEALQAKVAALQQKKERSATKGQSLSRSSSQLIPSSSPTMLNNLPPAAPELIAKQPDPKGLKKWAKQFKAWAKRMWDEGPSWVKPPWDFMMDDVDPDDPNVVYNPVTGAPMVRPSNEGIATLELQIWGAKSDALIQKYTRARATLEDLTTTQLENDEMTEEERTKKSLDQKKREKKILKQGEEILKLGEEILEMYRKKPKVDM